MHVPASPLAFQTDPIPLPIAICLSTIAVVSATIKVGSCFLQPQVKPWLLLISCISLGSSAGLLGVTSAGVHSNETLYVAHLDILQFCCALPGIFEAEFLWHLLDRNKYTWTQLACRGTAICSSLLTVGLCIWFPLQNAQASNVFIALLFATSAVYFGLSVAYFYLSNVGSKSRSLFLMNSALCLLVFISTCISLPVAWSKPEALVAAIWAISALSNVIAIRFPLCLLYRRVRHPLDSEVTSGSGVGRPSGQDSSTELVPSPAMDVQPSRKGFH